MAAQIIDLGKIRWSWRGTYSPSTEYELNDTVRYGGNFYVYILETPATGVVPTNTTNWSVVLSGINFVGTYNNATAYFPGDVVVYGGASYICITASTGNVPVNVSFWSVLADGIQYRGEYNALTAYRKRDVVRYGGSTYIANLATTGNLPTDLAYWETFTLGYPNITGQSGKLLTTDGTDVQWTNSPTLSNVTVNTELTSNGNTYIGVGAEAYETSAALTDAALVVNIDGGESSFAQVAFHNAEPTSSTDIIAYASNGDDTYGWVGIGITGEKFDDTTYGITGQGDAYVFTNAPEPSVVKSVTNKALTSSVATLTATAHGFQVGQRVVVSGVDSTFNGAYTITAVTTDTFSYAKSVGNVSPTAVSPAGSAKIQSAGNLVIATGDQGSDNRIVFAAGGYASGNTQMIIIPDQQVHIEIATNSTSPTTGALRVAGGVGITGDTFTDGDLTLDGILYVGPGAETFSTTQAGLTDPAIVTAITGGPSSFAQIAFTNSTATSSTDIIAYMNNGTDSEGWIGMGITGSSFDDTTYGITGPGDGYIFHETKSGPTGPLYTGNLVFATGDKGTDNKIVFAAGGFSSGTTQMEITPGVNVHIEIPTPSTSPTTGALTVVGGVGIQGDMNVQGSVFIEGTITFGGSGTTVETSNLAVTDPFVFVGTNNQADIVDLAFIGEYATSVSPIVRSITNKALTSNVATLTTSVAHTYLEGDVVTITGVDATFNGTFNIKAVPTATTFTYAKTAGNVSSTAVTPNGSASVGARRKFAGIARDATDGVIKVFRDATVKPTSTINFAEAGLAFADVRLGALTVSGATIGSVTNTEIGHLSGVTSAIQTQLNAKANSASPTITSPTITGTSSITGGVTVNATNASTVPLIARGANSQTAIVFDTQTVAGASLVNVSANGNLRVNTTSNDSFKIEAALGALPNTLGARSDFIRLSSSSGANNTFLEVFDVRTGTSPSSWETTGFRIQQKVDATNQAYIQFNGSAGTNAYGISFGTGGNANPLSISERLRIEDGGRIKVVAGNTLEAPRVFNAPNASYTLVLADAGKIIESNAAATITVPLEGSVAFPTGTTIDILQTGTGQVTVAGAGGVTVNATPGLKLRAQWSSATLIKRAANTWVLIGDLVP